MGTPRPCRASAGAARTFVPLHRLHRFGDGGARPGEPGLDFADRTLDHLVPGQRDVSCTGILGPLGFRAQPPGVGVEAGGERLQPG